MWSDMRIILAWIDPPKGSKASTAACADPGTVGSTHFTAIISVQEGMFHDYLFILSKLVQRKRS
jgi:hypothetical protein